MRDIDNGSSAPAIDITSIHVDVTAIDDFVSLLHDEVTQNLRPYSEQIIAEHRSGATFGVYSGSEPMHALRRDYYLCLYSGADGLRSYIEASEVLLGAAQKIAALYRETDAMAEARSQDVLAALNATQNELLARDQAAADIEAKHESDRESRRAGL